METLGLMDKTLYDITENELLDVWDTDFATVRNKRTSHGQIPSYGYGTLDQN